ncbi:MFS transporter [Leptospira ilyithenensis]|uniref:MFS transporter n=1 Tax=Leptospira ilyithenensis TaxID=2484901 RepID=A0A4R9LJ59_9LEPT|nr:MFS transporter [Leptospira ilyithenensis]TGN06906.1 MFS transporter [Leptospira ilyithenensis]
MFQRGIAKQNSVEIFVSMNRFLSWPSFRILILINLGTVLGLSGIDLILPSIPDFTEVFPGSSPAQAQWIIAFYVLGTSVGLLVFSFLADRFDPIRLFSASLLCFAILSLVCIFSVHIYELILFRFFQGLSSSGAAVLAPGLIRGLFTSQGAMRAISIMGSMESMVPAFAPLLGAYLAAKFGWKSGFQLTAIFSLIISMFLFVSKTKSPDTAKLKLTENAERSYKSLFTNFNFLRYALSHAGVLGGLLVFVFSAPNLIVTYKKGEIESFILLQIISVAMFFTFAQISSYFVKKLGPEKVILAGTAFASLSAVLFLFGAYFQLDDPLYLICYFIPINIGLGLRGGTGFVNALIAAGDNDARGSAFMILAVTVLSGGITGILSPFLKWGLGPIAIAISVLVLPSMVLVLMKRES